MDIFEGLNDKQAEAVRTVSGPLLILAGAGSGKTRTVIHRIAYLINECNVAPWRILALTFTNKAAGEMRSRIEGLGIKDSNELWMGTFHSICARILRRHAASIGFTRDFTIYDEADKKNVVKDCIAALNISEHLLTAETAISAISNAKNDGVFPGEFEASYSYRFGVKELAEVYTAYQRKLAENNAMDFDDLLLNVYRLFLDDEATADIYRNRFLHVVIDEYQDTNHLQYEIVSLIAKRHGNICVVGDDDQSIYGWRGADIRNILEFEEDFPNAKVIRLEQNYRSTSNILDAANALIANNKDRKGKNLWTNLGEGEKITIMEHYRDLDEGDAIALEVKKLAEGGMKYSDMAVLYRTNAQSRVIEESFLRASIPYQIVRGTKFYERAEVKDVMAYLKLAVNPKDELAFSRAIASPKRGIGTATLDKFFEYAAFKGMDLMEACLNAPLIPTVSSAARVRFAAFGGLIGNIASCESLPEAVKMAMDKSGYKQSLMKNPEDAEGRLHNLDELVSAAADFETTSEDKSLSAFLENAALIAGADTLSDGAGQCLLMSIHNSKGLEFGCVFVAGMEENLFPLAKASEDDSEMEEERRLCYVAMTRAQKRLYLSYANQRRQYGNTRMSLPSRFIDEIPERFKQVNSANPIATKTERPFTYKPQSVSLPKTPKKPSVTESFSPGDKLSHKSWGVGTVIDVAKSGSDTIITVAFAGLGIKKIMLGVTEITKV